MTLALVIQTLALVASVVTIITAVQARSAPKAKYFILLSISAALYALGYFMELTSVSLSSAYTATRIQYVGIPFIAPSFYLFVRDYANREIRNKKIIAALFIVPVFVMAMANAYPASRLFFQNLTFATDPAPALVINYGPAYLLDNLYGGTLMALSGITILRHLPRRTGSQRRQRIMFMCAAFLPLITVFTFAWDLVPWSLNLSSASFCFTELILGAYIRWSRQEEWMPFARERVVENLEDAFVLLDTQDNFLDANAAAKTLFPQMQTIPAGTPAASIQDFPLELVRQEGAMRDFELRRGDETHYLRLSTNSISRSDDETICTVVMFYDATELHHLMSELHTMATHDALTGLWNRGHFFQMAGRDFSLSQRTGQRAVVMMLDIDHFKKVNDLHGHQCGDSVLVAVAHAVQDNLRSTDICGRHGGEEFCIFLPGASRSAAQLVAEKLRLAIEQMHFQCEEKEFRVTISVGLAALDHQRDHRLEDLIAHADEALYMAKNSGRNRVASYLEVLERKAQ